MRACWMMVGLIALTMAAAWAEEGLQGAEFEGTDLRAAKFTNCDLREAHFERCQMGSAVLTEITEAAQLSLKGCRFVQSQWSHVTWDDPKVEYSRIEGLDGYDVELDEWSLERSELTELSLSYCEFRDLKLENCTIRDLRADYLHAPRGRWRDADLSDGDFDGCDFSDADFYRGSFEDARLRYVDLSDAVFENCDIRGLVINGVRIDELIH